MLRQPLTCLAALLVLAGCAAEQTHLVAPRNPEPKSVEGPEPQLAAHPVIVHIANRHQTITVTAAPDGPRVTARNADGRLLCQALTLDELRQQQPALYRQVQGQATASTPLLDASLGAD